jgi:hypothetical protein
MRNPAVTELVERQGAKLLNGKARLSNHLRSATGGQKSDIVLDQSFGKIK